jgi:hypothetical protein
MAEMSHGVKPPHTSSLIKCLIWKYVFGPAVYQPGPRGGGLIDGPLADLPVFAVSRRVPRWTIRA